MLEKHLIDAEEVARFLGISKPYAYKVMRQLNDELEQAGRMVIAGKISKDYLEYKFYVGSHKQEERLHACV